MTPSPKSAINQTALYREAAAGVGIAVPDERAAPVMLDGRVWDARDADAYAAYTTSFAIHA